MKKLVSQLAVQHRKAVAAITVLALQSNAFALGGLDKATSAAQEVKTGLYALVGVIAMLYLIFLGVQAFTERKSWADFGWGVVHVSLVGGAVALGTWAWSLFA